MKKKITILLSVIALTLGHNASAQAVSEGSIIIDPYYGFPNWGATIAKGATSVTDANVTGIGPAGIRAEYMLADNFGLGIDFIYNSFNIKGTADYTDSLGFTRTYDVKVAAQRYRAHLRMNYHFVQTDNLDAYAGLGFGTNIRRGVVTTDIPDYEDNSISGAIIPVSMRVALGMRYYFTENFGLNLEAGLGGPIMAAGLSLKF